MLTFFRRIRKGLLDGGATRKYLLYAIGEILLVMIGILLALQVNNWNESLKEQQSELMLLRSLKEEITANLEELDGGIKLHVASKDMCLTILEHFGDQNRTIDTDFLDSLVELASAPYTINLKKGIVKSIIATGDLKYLTNDLIVQFVTVFEDMLEESTKGFERLIGVWQEQLWPLENLYIRRMSRIKESNEFFGYNLPQDGSISDYDSFFHDIALENSYMLTLYELTTIIENEKLLLENMETVLDLVNSELIEKDGLSDSDKYE